MTVTDLPKIGVQRRTRKDRAQSAVPALATAFVVAALLTGCGSTATTANPGSTSARAVTSMSVSGVDHATSPSTPAADPTTPEAPPSDATTPATPVASSTAPAVSLRDKRFWHAVRGSLFQIDLTSAELVAVAGSTRPNVTIDATVTNLTDKPARYSEDLSMTVASQRYDLHCRTTADTPGGGSSPMLCTATSIATGSKLADAVITAGDDQSNQSVVPLKDGEAPKTFKPLNDFANGKSFTAGVGSTATVTKSILYQDDTPGKKDRYIVEMRFALTIGTAPPGFETIEVTLNSPDGSSTLGKDAPVGVFHSSDFFTGGTGDKITPVLAWTVALPTAGHYKVTTVSRTVRIGRPGTDGGFEFELP